MTAAVFASSFIVFPSSSINKALCSVLNMDLTTSIEN